MFFSFRSQFLSFLKAFFYFLLKKRTFEIITNNGFFIKVEHPSKP